MPRYVQVQNQAGDWELIEIEYRQLGVPRLQIVGASVREAYKSIIDGTVVTGQQSERKHMQKHGVVRQADFGENNGAAYYRREAEKRDAFMRGESVEHRKDVKKSVVETIQRIEQGQTPSKPIKEV